MQEACVLKTAVKKRKSERIESGSPQREIKVTTEQIRARAFENFEQRNGGPGSEVEDWLRAEQELTEAGAPKPSTNGVAS